jgi:hypothetical protein
MGGSWLLLQFLLPLILVPCRATTGPLTFSPEEVEMAKAIFPSFELASRLTGERDDAGRGLYLVSIESTRWKRAPEGTVLVAATVSHDASARYSDDDCPADRLDPDGLAVIAALRRTKGPWLLLGRATQPVFLCESVKTMLDTGAYRIRESEHAFAFRQQTTRGGRTTEHVGLYRLLPEAAAIGTAEQPGRTGTEGNRRPLLTRILEADWPIYDRFTDYKVVLSVATEQTNGFFNIRQVRTEQSVLPEGKNPARAQTSVWATYAWDVESQAYRPLPK